MPRFVFINTFIAALVLAPPVFAYSPQWLACTGELTISPASGAPTRESASDVYVYDPDAQNLFKYSDAQKRLAYLGAKPASEQEMRWSGSTTGLDSSQWDGRLDRKTGSLTLSYKSEKETRSWSESCKPTDPRPES